MKCALQSGPLDGPELPDETVCTTPPVQNIPPEDAPPAIADLTAKFLTAAQKQAGYFEDLSGRVDRLEKDFDPAPLRDAMREICQSLEKIGNQTEIDGVRADAKIVALADAMELLGKNVASARDETQRIRISVHQEMMSFTELVQAVETRMEQIEKSLADLKQRDTQASDRAAVLAGHVEVLAGNVGTLAGNVDALTGNVGTVSGNVKTIQGDLGIVAGKVAALTGDFAAMADNAATLKGKVGTLAGNIDGLTGDVGTISVNVEALHAKIDTAQVQEGRLGERLQVAETGLASAKEREQALGQMYARLAEAFAPVASRA